MTYGDLHIGAPIFYEWNGGEDQNIDARRRAERNNIDTIYNI